MVRKIDVCYMRKEINKRNIRPTNECWLLSKVLLDCWRNMVLRTDSLSSYYPFLSFSSFCECSLHNLLFIIFFAIYFTILINLEVCGSMLDTCPICYWDHLIVDHFDTGKIVTQLKLFWWLRNHCFIFQLQASFCSRCLAVRTILIMER